MPSPHDLLRRKAAADACVRRFAGKPLRWGQTDCVKLAALAMRKQGVTVPLLRGVRYSSETTALRRLRELGFDCLSAAMDATGLVRIAPARALPGDIVGLPTESEGFDVSLMVCVAGGSRELLGLDGAGRFAVLRPAEHFVGSWRVPGG